MIRDDLLSGRRCVAVWGAGFVGGTTAMAYAAEGVRVIAFDTNPEAVAEINRGVLRVANLEYWFGARMEEFVSRGLVRATGRWEDLRDEPVAAHFVAVPTEREGEPWDGAIIETIERLRSLPPALVIVESTLIPGRLERMDLGDLRIGVAPRRDWFHSPEKNLRNLPRVYAGRDAETTVEMREVLSIVCDHLLAAPGIREAELVKSVENALLHVPAVVAAQLARAYPGLDIGEVLRLASTHWRIPRYYPSFGTGGYCIPVSSRYVIEGAERPEALTILAAAVESDRREPDRVAEWLLGRWDGARPPVLLLGLAYKGDIKVHALSPAIRIGRRLLEAGVPLRAHDPYYTAAEVRGLLPGAVPVEGIEGGRGASAVVVSTDHKAFARLPARDLLASLAPGTLVLDNYGVWAKHAAAFNAAGIEYLRPGAPGYLQERAP